MDAFTPASRAALERRIADLEAEVMSLRSTEAAHERAPSATREQFFEAVIHAAPLAVFLKDVDHRYLFANPTLKRLAGRPDEPFRNRDDFELWPRPIAELFRAQDLEVMTKGEEVEFRETISLDDGLLSFITLKFPLFDPSGALLGIGGVCTDITRDVAAATRLERLVAKLKAANRQIEALEGILPICSYCKMIRADDGAWESMESYVAGRTQAEFSHSICPGCLTKHFPEIGSKDRDA